MTPKFFKSMISCSDSHSTATAEQERPYSKRRKQPTRSRGEAEDEGEFLEQNQIRDRHVTALMAPNRQSKIKARQKEMTTIRGAVFAAWHLPSWQFLLACPPSIEPALLLVAKQPKKVGCTRRQNRPTSPFLDVWLEPAWAGGLSECSLRHSFRR